MAIQVQTEPHGPGIADGCAPVPGGRPTILLAEDNPLVRRLLCLVLDSAGYIVLPAVDGRDALGQFLARADQIDLVVTDFHMPHMNGLELAAAVVRVCPAMRVLIVSGHPDLETNPWRCLDKPFLPGELVMSVAAALGSNGDLTAASSRQVHPTENPSS